MDNEEVIDKLKMYKKLLSEHLEIKKESILIKERWISKNYKRDVLL